MVGCSESQQAELLRTLGTLQPPSAVRAVLRAVGVPLGLRPVTGRHLAGDGRDQGACPRPRHGDPGPATSDPRPDRHDPPLRRLSGQQLLHRQQRGREGTGLGRRQRRGEAPLQGRHRGRVRARSGRHVDRLQQLHRQLRRPAHQRTPGHETHDEGHVASDAQRRREDPGHPWPRQADPALGPAFRPAARRVARPAALGPPARPRRRRLMDRDRRPGHAPSAGTARPSRALHAQAEGYAFRHHGGMAPPSPPANTCRSGRPAPASSCTPLWPTRTSYSTAACRPTTNT
ncbi:hypothetical protein ACRAWF_07265 [Streptomyces sp. L7]